MKRCPINLSFEKIESVTVVGNTWVKVANNILLIEKYPRSPVFGPILNFDHSFGIIFLASSAV